ncbi:MAG: CBS domain-containing protein, partial [Pseudomonadota bacterium]
MENLKSICDQEFIKVPSHKTVYDACIAMEKKGVGAVVVVEGMKTVGIFSERDVMNRVVVKGQNPLTTPLEKVMTS